MPILPSRSISALGAIPRSLDVAKAIAPAPWDPTVPQQASQQVFVETILLVLLIGVPGSSFALTKL